MNTFSKQVLEQLYERYLKHEFWAVSPGVIATEILSNFPEDRLQQVSNAIPLKRMGEAAEIANAVIWLCSDAASYITGHNLVIDGGFTVR